MQVNRPLAWCGFVRPDYGPPGTIGAASRRAFARSPTGRDALSVTPRNPTPTMMATGNQLTGGAAAVDNAGAARESVHALTGRPKLRFTIRRALYALTLLYLMHGQVPAAFGLIAPLLTLLALGNAVWGFWLAFDLAVGAVMVAAWVILALWYEVQGY